MKVCLWSLVFFVSLGDLPGQEADHVLSADEVYASWSRLNRNGPQRTDGTDGKQQNINFWRNKAALMKEAGDAFMRDFPSDGRRWELALRAAQMSRWLELENEAERVAAQRVTVRILHDIMAAPDAPAEIVEQAHVQWLTLHLGEIEPLQGAEALAASRSLRGYLDLFMAKYPASRRATNLERGHLNLLHAWDAEAADLRAQHLAQQDQNPGLVGLAEDWLTRAAYRGRVIAMDFIAADGRAVDLASMQGKVVLIDFWATWCGPHACLIRTR